MQFFPKYRGFFIETLDKVGYNLYKQIGGYHIHFKCNLKEEKL